MAGALERLARPSDAALRNSLEPYFAPPQEYGAGTKYPLSAVEGLAICAVEYDRGSSHLPHLAGLFIDKALNACAYPEHLAAIGDELGVEAEATVGSGRIQRLKYLLV